MDIIWGNVIIQILFLGLVLGLILLLVYSLTRFIKYRSTHQYSTPETLRRIEQKIDTLIEKNK
ncbi:DUF4083 family protein [Paenibacillus sp. IHBB 10380]|uniref:DUF4083 family protein n=1 Tax=Paenibacillus sp. IHBB 10380 TaxID=1566358 RepID=UPI0005CFC560|nr:hypothetical protein UB51_05860 [Paenibacillus sp. IHBB 10380]